MSLYKHIVVATDFSKSSGLALEEAIRLALRHQARLSLLHVIDDRVTTYSDILDLAPPELEAKIRQDAQSQIEKQLLTQPQKTVQCDVEILVGKPFAEISRFCNEEDASLLVVGQTGASFLERLLLGSTAERLLRHADAPLLLVKPDKQPGFQRILVGVDFSECSERAFAEAVRLARDEGSELHILHVAEFASLPPPATIDAFDSQTTLQVAIESRARHKLETFLNSHDLAGLSIHSHLVLGAAHQEMTRIATEKGCDLIVVGSVGRSGLSGLLLGNTAERIARSAPCSQLTIKPPRLLPAD